MHNHEKIVPCLGNKFFLGREQMLQLMVRHRLNSSSQIKNLDYSQYLQKSLYLCRRNERDEEGVYSVALECDAGRLYGLVRATDHAQRSGHRVVSHALYKLHPASVYWFASRGLAEIPAVMWMWGLVGTALDSVLWQH